MADQSTPPAEDAAAGADAAEVEQVHGHPVSYSRGQRTVHVPRAELKALVRTLRDEGWLQLLDVTAVDYLGYEAPRDLPADLTGERFELIVTVISHDAHQRLRLRVQVPVDDPVVDSLFSVHPGAESLEREVYDMFGIRFTDHPDLTRILMPEEWEGHPLRKDYPVGRIPVQFKGAPSR
jgi:NADH-quinone oxidoreductase subunit C